MIRAGLIQLTERGYSSVAVDEILVAACVPKGCFYHYFRSKADFGRVLIDSYHDYFSAKLQHWFDRDDLSPLNRLRAFVGDARQGMARHDFRRGCLIGNLGQEMAALPPEFRQQLTGVFDSWQRRTAACLLLARDAGEIGPSQDPDELAAFFWTGWEGAVLRAKLERSPQPLQRFANGFFALIQPQETGPCSTQY